MTEHTIWVTSNGLHTHLMVPSDNLKEYVPTLKPYFPDSRWLQVGWGDYQYYGNPQQTKLMGIKALFLPTQAVIGVLAIARPDEKLSRSSRVYSGAIDTFYYQRLLSFIGEYFKLDSSEKMSPIRGNDNGEDFFQAYGTYSILNTCNNWTARVLKAAGLNINPYRSISANYVEISIQENGFICH